MFIRSDNLFLRPAWPEDRPHLNAAGVPLANDPLKAQDLDHAMIVTMPKLASRHVAGTAGLFVKNNRWHQRIWLAPAFRHLGLFAEVEEALGVILPQLPDPRGSARSHATELQAA